MRGSYGDVYMGEIEVRFRKAPALICLFITSAALVWGKFGPLLPFLLLNNPPKGCETRNSKPLAATIDLLEACRIPPLEARHPEVSTSDILLVLRTGAGEFEVD